jgi:hypothetical protein
MSEDPIDDRDDVGEALAGPCPSRQDVVGVGPCGLDGVGLVSVQSKRAAVFDFPSRQERLGTEDALALRVQELALNEFVDGAARLERRVQLDQRLGPEQALAEFSIDVLADSLVGDADEALRILAVIVDQLPP